MKKVYCDNSRCKHHTGEKGCASTVKIGLDGKCESFEKGFIHYLSLVWTELSNSNFIDFVRIGMNPDLRIGIYYVCELYHLIYSESEWGTCRFLRFHATEGGDALGADEIMQREFDEKRFYELYEEFMADNLPGIKREESKKSSQPFGWLSPVGDFVEADFGRHEEAANDIIKKHGFWDEYREWKKTNSGRLCRDFLDEVKGYCLIHNPSASGGYIVSARRLTKNKKNFCIISSGKSVTDLRRNSIWIWLERSPAYAGLLFSPPVFWHIHCEFAEKKGDESMFDQKNE